jgi:transcriptional regulator with XRE-family HTH domain
LTKTPKRKQQEPRPGSKFPSQVLGNNVRVVRALRGLSQQRLRTRMAGLGVEWSQGTLSELENGLRPTSVDELFALALALKTTVVKLLDPMGVDGSLNVGIDLGVGVGSLAPEGTAPDGTEARLLLLRDDAPWRLEPNYWMAWKDDQPAGLFYVGKRELHPMPEKDADQ